MNIGLDLDNTLIDYSRALREIAQEKYYKSFPLSWEKEDYKHFCYSCSTAGEVDWMRLQGLTYGPGIWRAQIIPAAKDFLLFCKAAGHIVHVVSHRTASPHFLDDFDNHEVAREYLTKNLVTTGLLGKSNIHLCLTLSEKCKKISELQLDCFIDDLEKVFSDDGFPAKTFGYLYSKSPRSGRKPNNSKIRILRGWEDWPRIFNIQRLDAYKSLVSDCMSHKDGTVEYINSNKNSITAKIKNPNSRTSFFKYYNRSDPDATERMRRELNMISVLNEIPEKPFLTPQILKSSYQQLYIEADYYSSEPSLNMFEQRVPHLVDAFNFFTKFDTSQLSSEKISSAKEACFSLLDLRRQAVDRLSLVSTFIDHANVYVGKEIQALFDRLRYEFALLYKDVCLTSFLELDDTYRLLPTTLSHGDLSPSNIILTEMGPVLIDFEYSGIDSGVKSFYDLTLHPQYLENKDSLTSSHPFSVSPDRISNFKDFFKLRWATIIMCGFIAKFDSMGSDDLASAIDDLRRKINLYYE